MEGFGACLGSSPEGCGDGLEDVKELSASLSPAVSS